MEKQASRSRSNLRDLPSIPLSADPISLLSLSLPPSSLLDTLLLATKQSNGRKAGKIDIQLGGGENSLLLIVKKPTGNCNNLFTI